MSTSKRDKWSFYRYNCLEIYFGKVDDIFLYEIRYPHYQIITPIYIYNRLRRNGMAGLINKYYNINYCKSREFVKCIKKMSLKKFCKFVGIESIKSRKG